MFDRIARVYDRMNSVMTAGMHHRWRERAAELANVGPGSTALDVATGTGDLAIELARRGAEVTGTDFAPAMLEIARRKAPGLRFEEGDALNLTYPDGSFDAATVGFGARNFGDLSQGLREMARVVKPGGRVVILEITTPQKPPLSTFFFLWFDRLVPMGTRSEVAAATNAKPATAEPLQSLLKRARSAGLGIMLATQSPGDLDYKSRDQITSWFIGRVREDTALRKLRAAFQSESGLDPAAVLPGQTVGEFHLVQEGLVRPMRAQRSLISAEQVPFDRIEQLARETKGQDEKQLRLFS